MRAICSSKTRQICLICFGLTALTLLAFWPLGSNDFINYDDQQYVYENPHVTAGLTWAGLRWAFTTGYASNWHPLTWLSHMLDAQLFGLSAAGHHCSSLVLHIVNSLLLFGLLLRLTGAIWRSAFVAGLFAVHPLHVESVVWAAERKDVLSAFFFILTLWAYSRYVEVKVQSPTPINREQAFKGQGFKWYALGLLLFAFGLMSKPMLVTVPFLLLLMDFWPLGRVSGVRWQGRSASGSAISPLPRLLVEKIPFLLLSAASSVVTVLVQQKAMVFYKALPFPYRLANAAISYVRYLFKAIWPIDLAVLYPHPGSWPLSQIAGAGILLTVITLIVVRFWRTRPYLAVGWFWFLGMLVPVIGLVQVGVQAMADRYTYLPLVGIFIMFTWLAADWIQAWEDRLYRASSQKKSSANSRTERGEPRPRASREEKSADKAVRAPFAGFLNPSSLAAGLILALCALRSHTQARFWKDTETLFTHDLKIVPNSWVAHHNLALLALDRYQKSQHGSVESQLLTSEGQPSSGPTKHDYLQYVIDHCNAALAAKPTIVDVHVTLAKALVDRGQLDEARAHLELAMRGDPKNAQAKQTFAEILHRQGRGREAAEAYRATLELEPDWGPVINNLAWLLATSPDAGVRNGPEATRLAERACNSTEHTNLWYLHTLAAACAESGNFSNAVAAAEEVRRLSEKSGNPELIRKAENRLQLYQLNQPLRDP